MNLRLQNFSRDMLIASCCRGWFGNQHLQSSVRSDEYLKAAASMDLRGHVSDDLTAWPAASYSHISKAVPEFGTITQKTEGNNGNDSGPLVGGRKVIPGWCMGL
jgi:hypothetical protein